MPILREHDIAKVFREPIDDCYDFIALRYGKCAAGTEVVLYIDNDEHIAVADRISRGQFCLLVFLPCVLCLNLALQLPGKTQRWRARLSTSSASLIRSSPTATG